MGSGGFGNDGVPVVVEGNKSIHTHIYIPLSTSSLSPLFIRSFFFASLFFGRPNTRVHRPCQVKSTVIGPYLQASSSSSSSYFHLL